MLKRTIKILGILGLVVLFVGCSQKPRAQKAVESFVNTEFYLKDFDTYEQAFGHKVAKESKTHIQTELSKELIDYGIQPKDSSVVAEAMLEAIMAKTSVVAKTISEENERATVELTIKGIDMTQFQADIEANLEAKLLTLINEAGLEDVKHLDDLTNLTSEEDVSLAKTVVADFSEDSQALTSIIKQAITAMKRVEYESKLRVELLVDKEKNNYWTIKNESTVIDKLTKALMN